MVPGVDHWQHPFPHLVPVVSVNILRPDEDVVYTQESDGSTLVAQGDPNGDTYTIRLLGLRDHGETVVIALQSDGRAIASDALQLRLAVRPGHVVVVAHGHVRLDELVPAVPGRQAGVEAHAGGRSLPAAPDASRRRLSELLYETDANQGDFRLIRRHPLPRGLVQRPRLGHWPARVVQRLRLDDSQNWFDGGGFFNGYGGWFFDGDSWFDGHNWFSQIRPASLPQPALQRRPAEPLVPRELGQPRSGSEASAARICPRGSHVLLPNERGAGPPPVFRSVSCDA